MVFLLPPPFPGICARGVEVSTLLKNIWHIASNLDLAWSVPIAKICSTIVSKQQSAACETSLPLLSSPACGSWSSAANSASAILFPSPVLQLSKSFLIVIYFLSHLLLCCGTFFLHISSFILDALYLLWPFRHFLVLWREVMPPLLHLSLEAFPEILSAHARTFQYLATPSATSFFAHLRLSISSPKSMSILHSSSMPLSLLDGRPCPPWAPSPSFFSKASSLARSSWFSASKFLDFPSSSQVEEPVDQSPVLAAIACLYFPRNPAGMSL